MDSSRTYGCNFAEFCDLVPNLSLVLVLLTINIFHWSMKWEAPMGDPNWLIWCFCSPPVRRASANVVSIVAKYAVPAGEWPELLPFLFQCSQSAQEDHREVSSSCWKDLFLYSCYYSFIILIYHIYMFAKRNTIQEAFS